MRWAGRWSAIRAAPLRGRGLLLFVVSLVLLDVWAPDRILSGVTGLLVLTAGAFAASPDRRTLRLSLVLLLAVCGSRAAFLSHPERLTLLVSHLLTALFLGFVLSVLFRREVADPGRVTEDRIEGAVTVYLLLGLLGGRIANMLEALHPGSFSFPAELRSAAVPVTGVAESTFQYWSFVTLATLGYGDVVPVSRLAQTFAWMLAVTGQMYVAIVVAWLVSLGFSPKRSDPS